MKSALLPQNDNTVIESLKQNVGRSVFDLSHSTTFPIDVDGAILPIACIETVPSDSFEISVECLLRQLSPLKVPPMARFQLNTAWFYCDNRLAWKKWDRFMTGGRSGNETYDIPRMANLQYYKIEGDKTLTKRDLVDTNSATTSISNRDGYNQNYKNTLHTYFGISLNHHATAEETYDDITDFSDELPIAFPFFDYQIICRDFYTDVDRLSESSSGKQNFDNPFTDWTYSNLFPQDDDEIKLKDGPQMYSGFHTDDDDSGVTPGIILDKVRYHNVRDDYFTTSKKAPMRGDIPDITTTVAVQNIDFSDAIETSDDISTFAQYGLGVSNNKKLAILKGSSGQYDNVQLKNNEIFKESSGTQTTIDYDKTLSTDLLNLFNSAKIETQTIKAINAAEIRLLSQLTVWQELNMLHKPYYQDFLNAHFDGVRVGESAVEKPIYIGGTSQNIAINEILQTSGSTETSALGTQGATAMSLANNYVGKIYCNNYGYIIGVAYIITDMVYNPAMPRGFSRRTKEEFYSPEFANLSMQAILNKEIFFSNDDEWNNTAWGYTGIFDELRSIPNHVAGDLLNSNYTDLKKWVIRREFTNDNKPAMNSIFLSLKGNVDKTNWSVQSMPAFMLQCANYIKAVRPMPYLAIPKAL